MADESIVPSNGLIDSQFPRVCFSTWQQNCFSDSGLIHSAACGINIQVKLNSLSVGTLYATTIHAIILITTSDKFSAAVASNQMDSFLDYSVGIYTPHLDQYIERFSEDSVSNARVTSPVSMTH